MSKDKLKNWISMKICTTCVLPETFPGISFDEDGRCSYCRRYKGKDNQEQLKERLGHLLLYAKTAKLGKSPVVQASDLLGDPRSNYYAGADSTLYNLYNAITQIISDGKDLLYRPDKTMGLTKLLLN